VPVSAVCFSAMVEVMGSPANADIASTATGNDQRIIARV
jgi:hypothetical protein